MNRPDDEHGVISERIHQLKKSRSGAKGVVTKKRHELIELTKDLSNVDKVRGKVHELELALRKFQERHNRYHAQLESEGDIRESNEYFAAVERKVKHTTCKIDLWLQAGLSKLEDKIDLSVLRPEDSISNVGSRATSNASKSSVDSSCLSRVSSSVSAKLKASAKRAALAVEAAALKGHQAIQREEFLIMQRKEELRLETEVAKAEAEEQVYIMATERYKPEKTLSECASILPISPQKSPENKTSVAHATGVSTSAPRSPQSPQDKGSQVNGPPMTSTPQEVMKPIVQTSEYQTLPSLDANRFLLDPKAAEWRPCEQPHPNENPNSFTRSDSSERNVSQIVEVHRLQQQQNQQVQALLLQQQQQTIAMTLPQPELPVFSGDPIDYCNFVRAFENLIEIKTSSTSARLYYLVQYTSGDVKELMQSCLAMSADEGYKTARALLKSRYGQNYKVAAAYVDRVTKAPPIKAEDAAALQRYSVMLTSCKNALKEIGYLNKIENPDSLQRIIERLPFGLRQRWRDKADDITEVKGREVTISDVAEFVEVKARAANHPIFGNIVSDTKYSNANSFASGKRKPSNTNHRVAAFATQGSADNDVEERSSAAIDGGRGSTTAKQGIKCRFCEGSHWLSRCESFKGKPVEERVKFARSKGLCDNCLMQGHVAKSCPKESFCRIPNCKFKHRKHSTFLHPSNDRPDRAEAQGNSNPSNSESADRTGQAQNCFVNVEEGQCNSTGAGVSKTGLAIVPVKVKVKGNDKIVETYAFLDPGSNTSFCTDQLIDRLDANGRKTTLSLTTMDNENVKSQSLVVNLEVCDLHGNNILELPNVFSRPKLPVAVDDIPCQSDVNKWPHLKGIHLPEIDANIDLLIGNDAPKALEPKEVRESQDGGPYAVRTILGWTINGPLGRKGTTSRTANRIESHAELSIQFEKFCEMEFNDSQFNEKKAMSQEDRRALSIMEESVKLENGHYQIALPWRVYPPQLRNNKLQAEHRLSLLKKRLVKDPVLHQKYSTFMNNLIEKDYARKVPDDQLSNTGTPGWFLPHHPVVHPHKPDKVRVVFDCAAKFQGTSLNEQLMQGPDLMNTLTGVLTRFRQERTAIMADVESMFYQVRVPPKDCNYLRYLWWPHGDVTKTPEEYQMLVHLFGGVSSPSCASFGLLKTADDNQEYFGREVIETVRRNFYVDDCLKSVKSETEAIQLVDQLRQMLAKAGFRLTKWVANSRDVIRSVPLSERAGSVRELDLDHLPIERALGIQWDVQSDVFGFKIVVKDKPATRRGILSVVSSIYDPLGFVAPLILPAKAILQDLCRKGLGWDDPIPLEYLERWQSWLEELPRLRQFSVERCLKPRNFGCIMSSQLHTFSDASQQGYGAVTYLRIVNGQEDVHCAFLIGKSRQTPKKAVTIPRLELSAALVATRLSRMIQQELDLSVDEVFFWTDSTCVLSYIANQDKRFHTFVANRISKIQEGSLPSQWRYVDTGSNPADDASRGLSAEELIHHKRWICGPTFLWKEEDEWPRQPEVSEKIQEKDPEVKREVKSFAVTSDTTNTVDRMIEHYSSWYRLKKFIAWVLRYRSKLLCACRRRKEGDAKKLSTEKVSPITVEELEHAEKEVLRYIQRRSFGEEISCLETEKSKDDDEKLSRRKFGFIKKSSSIYKLDPVRVDGLLRVGGRLKHAPIRDETRHPIILPKKHHVVDLIVRHFHLSSGHSGQEYVLSLIREEFWIIKARVTVRKVVNCCFSCRKRQAAVGTQKMADLPVERVTPGKPPFSFVGVDCFGPFVVRRGRSQVKRYGVLYTCLATRAIHIEVAQSMDTGSFVNSMRRFISRRGAPEVMRSDNGTNFVSGNKELRQAISEWNDQQIHEYLLQRNVKWIFNPPSGSHHGGVWERCIRTVRKVLGAVLKEQTLDDEGLTTLMCEVESIVNSRPITKSSDDPLDSEPLTPNHLLLLRSGSNLPPGLFNKNDTHSRRRWRQVQYLADVFWRRWMREYLPQLQERQKWVNPARSFQVDDVVLVVDDRVPRSSWPLGRVVEVHKNRHDGYVRSVTVMTKSSVLNRPIDKIVLLEAVEATEGS